MVEVQIDFFLLLLHLKNKLSKYYFKNLSYTNMPNRFRIMQETIVQFNGYQNQFLKNQSLFLKMAKPLSRSLPSQIQNQLSQRFCNKEVRLRTSYLLPNSSSFYTILRSCINLLAPSYLVLVSNQLVVLEIPYIFLAYCQASLYFALTLIPFSMTFIQQVIIFIQTKQIFDFILQTILKRQIQMKKNVIKEQQKLKNKIDKDSSQESQELNDQPKELDFIAKFKRKDAMFITYRGVIQTGHIHFADSLTLMYKIVANQNWRLSHGQDTGFSQNASLGDGKLVWNFPFQPTYETKNPVGWPQLMVVLYGKDYFGRSVAKGYGNVHLPSGEGNHVRKIKIFETIPLSNMANCCAFLLGYINELKLPQKVLLGEQQNRQLLRVKSIGEIVMKVEVRRYNFEQYGYQ